MGCDWIETTEVVFGYVVDYDQVFPRGTAFGDAEVLYESEVYEEYGEENPHVALAEAWAAALPPELAGVSAILGTMMRPGTYEATRYARHSRVVFGYSLSKALEGSPSWREALSSLELPPALPAKIREFLADFRLKLNAPVAVTLPLNLSQPRLVGFV
jgi:hypothetical protein